jgi:hypothetical protein
MDDFAECLIWGVILPEVYRRYYVDNVYCIIQTYCIYSVL